jgi:hypothetical protein
VEVEYRLFFDNKAAQREQLNKIDEITIDQEVDMAWEARLQVPVTVDEKGNWTGDDEDFMRPFCRVRVEIKIKQAPYVPLFDGPITGFDSRMSSEPGQSTITLIAQDDTFYLNRVEKVTAFENKSDHEVAEQLFNDFGDLIGSTKIDTAPSSGSALTPLVVQRGTAMQLLRFLAKRQGMHAYVLPGDKPGQSIGCYNAFPTKPDGLPPLILLGAKRNIDSLQVRYCACKPSDATASTLRITDKQVVTETSRAGDVEMMGDETAEESSKVDMQILPPRQGESVDLRQAADAVVRASGYSYEVAGSILEDTYAAALRPYRVIAVQAGNTPISGNYLVSKATHKITRTAYSQSFSLTRNARSSRFGSGQTGTPGGIF